LPGDYKANHNNPDDLSILHDDIGFNPDDMQEVVHSLSYV
jgi:hypothetical protein